MQAGPQIDEADVDAEPPQPTMRLIQGDGGRDDGERDDGARGERDERQLLLRHREGDPDAFAALVGEYRSPVFAYLSRAGIDPADRDDVFQEVFLRIHRAAASYQAHRPVHPWIFTIVCNTVRTYLRRKRVRELVSPAVDQGETTRRGGAPTREVADPRPDGERRAAARERVAQVEKALDRLSLPQREVVLLACVEKLALKQVAAVLEMPINTVKTHLRRARLALARTLAESEVTS